MLQLSYTKHNKNTINGLLINRIYNLCSIKNNLFFKGSLKNDELIKRHVAYITALRYNILLLSI